MAFPGSPRANGLRRAALGAAIAGLGTCAYLGLGRWIDQGGPSSPDWPVGTMIGVLIGILILTAIGAAAGLISGRFRDAPASWAAAVIGFGLAYQALYTIDPSWPTSEDGLWGSVLYAAVFLSPFIVGGHLLGAWARVAIQEGKASRIRIVAPLFVILAGVAVSTAIVLNTSPYADGYRPANAADIAAAFNMKSLPTQLQGLPLDNTSTYDSATAGRAYYAVWDDGSRRQIQVVLNTRVPTGGSPYGFTDEGGQVTFQVFEGDTCLQVFAPDLPSLRAAVAAARPGLTSQLEQEIAHPTTPQPKEAPTE
jgi:hypothetical protein